MILWALLTVMIALAAVGLTIPLVRRHDAAPERDGALAVLKEQLRALEGEQAEGRIAPEEAEGLAHEIKRRILAEARDAPPPARPLRPAMMPMLALGLALIVAIAATGLYALLGHPGIASVSGPSAALPSQAANAQPQHPMGDVATMIAGLEAKLQQTPDDAQGWQMLGWSYSRTGRLADAANAYAKAVALDPKNGDYLSAEGEALVQAANGTVTPDAVALFRRTLAVAPDDPRARYFLAMAMDQRGDHKGAMAAWIALIKSAAPDAPWLAVVRQQVEDIARQNGMDISAQLPPAPPAAAPAPSAAPPGPTQADIAAASGLSDADRQAMIRGMVDRLAAQLKASPRDADGWVRLMRARMVLGQAQDAAAAYGAARKAFAGSPSDLAALKDAAHGLGIPGA